jgi:hypothetical protein
MMHCQKNIKFVSRMYTAFLLNIYRSKRTNGSVLVIQVETLAGYYIETA